MVNKDRSGGSKRVAWCLWDAAGNGAASSGAATVGVLDGFSEGARCVLQLLAVDQHGSEEAAAAELADIEVAIEVAGLALFIQRRSRDRIPLQRISAQQFTLSFRTAAISVSSAWGPRSGSARSNSAPVMGTDVGHVKS